MKGYNGSRQSQAWRCNFKSEPTSMACSQTQAFQHCCKDWWDQKFPKISRNFSKFRNYFLVPDDQLQTVFQYSKILEQNSSPTQGQLIEGNGLGQRSAALGRDTNSLLYPRCIKEPYKVWVSFLRLVSTLNFFKGPCRALEYRWSWSTEENGCVIYPFGGCVEEGVDMDGENSFDVSCCNNLFKISYFI